MTVDDPQDVKRSRRSSMPRYSSASAHAPIPAPTYPVLSQQPVSLTRSQSCTEFALGPTISGGLARRLSISSTDEEAEVEPGEILRAQRVNCHELPGLRGRGASDPVPPSIMQATGTTRDSLEHELAELPVRLGEGQRHWRPRSDSS